MTTPCTLSICIPTLNRGPFIGETLNSIVRQLTEGVEVVIVDGGSTDETEQVVRGYIDRFERIRYLKRGVGSAAPSNEGFDRDCDFAVELAQGLYCWLMTDDDLLAEGAVAEVLTRVAEGHDLLIACTKVCNVDLSNTLVPSLPEIRSDKRYDRSDWTSFAMEVGPQLTFVGRVIIKRAVWQARERARYFGSGFVHAGVIFSEPMDSIIVLSKPLVILRYGNALWTSRAFDLWMYHWPRLVWSFTSLSEAARTAVTPRYPFKSAKRLLWYRALGAYTMDRYRSHLSREPGLLYRFIAAFIARMPVVVSNALCGVYLSLLSSRQVSLELYDLLHCGHASALTRTMARRRGVS